MSYKETENTIYKVDNKELYGQKEVPNIKLCAYSQQSDEAIEIYFDTVKNYQETFDSSTGFTTIFTVGLFSPQIYETLTQPFTKFTIETSNWWHNAENGKDCAFTGLIREYNHMKIEHIVNVSGDSFDWKITLENN